MPSTSGSRRGSALFSGDRLITMLDFDSARYEARVLDLAIALHDLAKVFGERGSPDFEVPLDLEVVSEFFGAYLQANPLCAGPFRPMMTHGPSSLHSALDHDDARPPQVRANRVRAKILPR